MLALRKDYKTFPAVYLVVDDNFGNSTAQHPKVYGAWGGPKYKSTAQHPDAYGAWGDPKHLQPASITARVSQAEPCLTETYFAFFSVPLVYGHSLLLPSEP